MTDLIERLLSHVEQVCWPLSEEVCEVAGDDDRNVLKAAFAAEIGQARADTLEEAALIVEQRARDLQARAIDAPRTAAAIRAALEKQP